MVKILIALATTALILVLLAVVVPANADEWNKKTVMTFSQAVELPGIVLPPGTYVFRLTNSLADRHIVQVFNSEENHIYATILAIPDYRLTPTGKTVMRFEERPVGAPEAIRAWFYPGDNFGQEFVYPKVRATELARETRLPVLTADVKPTETPEELVKAPVVAVTPEKKEVEVAQVVEPKPVEPKPVEAAPIESATPAPELPKTASPLPLVALLGLASLGLAGALRIIVKRSS